MATTTKMITKYDTCVICGAAQTIHHHHLLEGSKRGLATEDGLIIPLCAYHHDMSAVSVHLSPEMNKMSKIIGQLAWERNYCAEGHTVDQAREEFIRRYGKAYI